MTDAETESQTKMGTELHWAVNAGLKQESHDQ